MVQERFKGKETSEQNQESRPGKEMTGKGKRPKWNMTKMEDDQNGRRPKWKTTKTEDNQN